MDPEWFRARWLHPLLVLLLGVLLALLLGLALGGVWGHGSGSFVEAILWVTLLLVLSTCAYEWVGTPALVSLLSGTLLGGVATFVVLPRWEWCLESELRSWALGRGLRSPDVYDLRLLRRLVRAIRSLDPPGEEVLVVLWKDAGDVSPERVLVLAAAARELTA